MTFPTTILTGTTIADADLEGLTAAQVNAYGKLLPRQISVHEFRAVTGNLAINETVRSQHFAGVVDNDKPATCLGTFDNYNSGNKGLRLLYDTGALTERKMRLPDQFNLLHADHGGTAINLLMYFWMTQKAAAEANLHAIAGYGYQTSGDAQWLFDYDGAASNYRFRVLNDGAAGNANVDLGSLDDDAPTLFGFHIYALAGGSSFFKVDAYKNGAFFGSGGATPAFPFNDLSGVSWAGNPPYPILGRRGGYNVGHDVVMHTAGLARITEHDDVAAFMAAEYALNATALAA